MTQLPGLALKINLMQLQKINSSTLTADNNNTSSLAEGYDPTSLLFIANSISWEFVVPEDCHLLYNDSYVPYNDFTTITTQTTLLAKI